MNHRTPSNGPDEIRERTALLEARAEVLDAVRIAVKQGPRLFFIRIDLPLTLPMLKSRGFLVRRPLRRLRGIGVLHDLPKREFPCAPRYVLFPFMQLWICLPKPCAGCSLRHSHLCRDGFRMLGNPICGRSNPLSVDSDSRRRSKSDSTGRRYRL